MHFPCGLFHLQAVVAFPEHELPYLQILTEHAPEMSHNKKIVFVASV